MRKVFTRYMQVAKGMGLPGLEIAAKLHLDNLTKYILLQKLSPDTYQFLIDTTILLPLDSAHATIPGPLKKFVGGGSSGVWTRIAENLTKDLNTRVAQKMKIKPEAIQII